MIPLLVHLRPFDIGAAAPIDVRVASGPNADTYGLGGFAWAPALIRRPMLSLDLMSLDLDGKTQLGTARFSVGLNQIAGFDFAKSLRWMGAPVTIYSARELSWPTANVEFVGMVSSVQLDPDTRILEIQATVQLLMDRPLLTLEFSGSGGANGDADMKGTLKPAGFGVVEGIEPVWFDKTRWIGMIDGYANTISVQGLLEGADDRGAAVANYANYAALAAAIDADAVAPGRWATCIAEGLVGLGAPPEYPIGVNATFGSGLVGSMMKRMLLTHVPLVAGAVDSAAFDALDIAVPFAAHYWTKSQVTVQERIEAISASANATPLVNFQNKVTVTRAVTSASVATLDRSGQTTPRVVDWQSASPLVPFWKIRARVARPANVLSFDQVLYEDDIIFMGRYSALETYRSGNMVDLGDQSTWLYINATPAAGNPPPAWPTTSNAWWQNMSPPAATSDLKYADGTPIENLKPAEAGANITGTHTAAAIAGQGALATMSTVPASYLRNVAAVAMTASAEVQGNDVVNVSGTQTENASGVGPLLAAGSAFIECDIWTTGFTLLSLDNDNTTVANASQVYRFQYNRTTGAATLYVNGAVSVNTNIGAGISGRIGLYYNGFRLFARVGSTLVANIAAAASQLLYPKWTAYEIGSRCANVEAGHYPAGAKLGTSLYLSDGSTIGTDGTIVTASGTAAAIAGQGALATVSIADFNTQVGGVGVPDPFASAGDNYIANASLAANADNWTLGGGAARAAGVNGWPVPGAIFANTDNAYFYANKADDPANRIEVVGGRPLYIDVWLLSQDIVNNKINFEVEFYKADRTTSLGSTVFPLTGAANNVWSVASGTVTPGLDAAFARMVGTFDQNNTGAGSTYFGGLRLGVNEISADVTRKITGVAETMIGVDYLGAVKTGQVNPRYVFFKLEDSTGADVTNSAAWSAAVTTGTATVAVGNTAGVDKGRLNITGAASNSTVTLTATYRGRTYTFLTKVTRDPDDPPSSGGGGSGGGGSASGNISGNPTSTVMVAVGDELEVTIGSGGNAQLSGEYDFNSNQVSGSQTCYLRWYKWNGASYAAIGSEVQSTSSYIPTLGEPGNGRCDFNDTGNTASSVQKYRLYGRSGGSYTTNITGSCSAVVG